MITPEHWQEWVDSAVDPHIIRLNVRSLEWLAAYEYLLYSDRLPRTNPGVLARGILNTYSILDSGGWWCSGVDPLNDWQPMLWGCFKPNRPRFDFEKRKHIKYEHPPKEETRAFFLRVNWFIGLRIASVAGKERDYEQRILQAYSKRETGKAEAEGKDASSKTRAEGHQNRIDLSPRDRGMASSNVWIGITAIPEEFLIREDAGFWEWVYHEPAIPLIVTEGAKKAGGLLTAGYAALALPGINSGYRTPKDEEGNRTGKSRLIPDLQYFATLGREVSFCFDRDQKRETIRSVNKAIEITGYLFTQSGCKVRVICLPGPEKGVDDFVAHRGAEALDALYQAAHLLENWQARSFSQLTYPAALTVERRYLGDISIPDDAFLVALKSPKGTGKTQFLESVVSDTLARGQWVLVPGHRVQLVEALCHRFGIPYVTEVRSSETGAALGYGLCIDSLHPGSQARFNAENWKNGVVILDECEQVIWHALNSSTCQTERVPILRELKTLLSNVLNGKGRVLLADADLSDLSIDFVRSLSGRDIEPWVVVNEWQPGLDDCWNVHNYGGKDPSGLVDALEKHITDGGKPFVVCSAQKAKSKWGTRTLESHFKNLFPDKQILRIDSETISDPSHPAFGCVANLNAILRNYDIVLASPSIETGVSLDLKGHFTSVWGIFQGVQAESSARQALARLREPVDRHIWAASYGIGKIGNGSTSVKSVLASQHKLTRANIRLLQDSAFDDIELNFQPESLRTWAKMAVRVNLGMVHYRQSILDGLSAEGHQIIDMGAVVSDSVKAAVTDTRDENHQAEARAIAASPDITQSEFEKLTEQKTKTLAERHTERKHSLELRYGIPVDADLVLKDDDGWYPQLRLHYFLTVGDEFLNLRDSQRVQSQLEKGQGALWQPDLNKGQMSAAVAVMKNLGISDLMHRKSGAVEVRATDEAVQRMASIALANPRDIKTALNISISDKDTPVAILSKLLGKLGLKLDYLRREGSDGNRQRVYGYTDAVDARDEIFAAWLERDRVAASAAVSTPVTSTPLTSTPGNKEIITNPVDVKTLDVNPQISKQEAAPAASPTAQGRVVEILTRCGQWLSGYSYVGRRGDRHQLADSTGYRGIFVSDSEFRFAEEMAA